MSPGASVSELLLGVLCAMLVRKGIVECQTTLAFPTIIPIDPTTAKPTIPPPISTIEQFPGECIPGGLPSQIPRSLAQCYDACFQAKSCSGFDFHVGATNECLFHMTASGKECSTRSPITGCTHYRLRGACVNFALCQATPMTLKARYAGYHGSLVAQTTLVNCRSLCETNFRCAAFDHEIATGYCYLFDTTGVAPRKDDCCVHGVKECVPFFTRVVPTVTPAPTPSVAPDLFPAPPTIPDNGGCPDPFLRVDGFGQLLGELIPFVDTLEGCKQACLGMAPNCLAVDYNLDHTNCFYHKMINVMDVRMEKNVIHLVLTNCVEKQCWVHPEVNAQVLNPQTMMLELGRSQAISNVVNLAGLQKFVPTANSVPCMGTCAVVVDFTQTADGAPEFVQKPYVFSRECRIGTQPSSAKQCTFTGPNPGLRRAECQCYGHRCNAFAPILLQSCVAFLPFDSSLDDLTQAGRRGKGVNVRFEVTDVKKNVSVYFDGEAFIKLNSFRDIFYGSLTKDGSLRPSFTITFWMKRIGATGRQVILSNGAPEDYTLLIVTEPNRVKPDEIIIAATVYVDSIVGAVECTVAAPAKLSEWTFVALAITNSPALLGNTRASGNYYLTLTVSDTDGPAAVCDTGIPGNTQESLGILGPALPLIIGQQYQNSLAGAVGNADDFFVGLLDEMYFWSRDLSSSELASVKETSDQPDNFYP